ncbi:MAG: TMCO4 family protein [Actinomycetota bacterium]|nr:TMCO4 family protein [Actinomycetota bacterium]
MDEYMTWLEFERINASRVSTVAAASLAGLTVVAPMALFAAPAIGGAIGAWGGLSGAAATSHGLAFLGGGALAAGGFGMTGGTIVVAAGGAAIGSAAGASVATSYVRSDKSFGFDKVADGDETTVIFANGFLSEGQKGWGTWERVIGERYPNATVYRLTWGAKELKALGVLAGQQFGAAAARAAVEGLASQASKGAGRFLGPLSGVFVAAGVAKNPWHVARTRATMTGSVLADAIVRADLPSVVLVGFSLGARVIVAAAESLATRHGEAPRIETMHLLGAAVGTRRDWRAIETAVSGTVWNYWSKNDFILKYLYKTAEVGQKAVGFEGIPTRSPRIKNVNVSRLVPSHMTHVKNVTLR